MWIVKLALRRPYTFVVMALLILVLGGLSIVSMSTDIFPNINIPVVTVLWQYGGLTPDDMAKRIATYSEYVTSSTVDNIRTIESQTLSGISVIKVFLQPGANIDGAIAQLASVSQTVLRFTPPGTQPPFILRYNASSVPILQLSLSSPTWSEAQLYDYGLYRVRQALAPIQGLTLPLPYGGKPRQIMVDLDPQALLAKGLSPNDVSTAITAQNLTLPSGTAKMGTRDYIVSLNSSPSTIAALNEVPIKQVNGATIYVRDIGHVRDGFDVQTNIVRQDGRRSVLLTILKSGGASTLDIVKRVQASLPDIRAAAPAGLELKELFDQSLFVRAAVRGVVTEGAIAACLTGLMILLFLGSWRSTLIVILSIPLSLLVSVITLYLLGQTLNVMTLGGLALAVGIVVDDTTVELENVHRNASQGKGLMAAILDGAQQIATPAFVSTLAICIVFVPVVLLTGRRSSSLPQWPSLWSSPSWPPTSCHGPLSRRSCAICWPMSWPIMTRQRNRRPHHRTCSAVSITPSPAGSSASGSTIARHWRGLWRIGYGSVWPLGACSRVQQCCCPSWAGTSSPAWMPDNSGCT
jgi:multidrug efflux pump subunit AcrB